MTAIRNTKAFVKSYLNSESGKAALARKDIRVRDKDTGKMVDVRRSNQMAVAFQDAIAK